MPQKIKSSKLLDINPPLGYNKERTFPGMLYATLRNQKWVENQKSPQDTPQVKLTNEDKLLAFCTVPRSQTEMIKLLGLSDRKHFREKYLKPLLNSGLLVMTIPDKPNSRNQKYIKATNA